MTKIKEITLKIVMCPEGHEVRTAKTKGIQCKRCAEKGIGKRFDIE